MSGVASKNPYDLLGNDADEDGDVRAPVVPIEKPAQRTGKRNANGEGPPKDASHGQHNAARGGRGGRRGEHVTGSEAAAQDRQAGSRFNREKPVGDGTQQDRRGGRVGRGDPRDRRGARGARDDRHSKTGIGPNDHQKQAAHGWGDDTAEGELQDEKAGEAIADQDKKEPEGEETTKEGAVAEVEEEAEPEDKSKSYADYLAEQESKRAALGGVLEARKPNEGSKKLEKGTAVTREETEYFAGAGGRAKRERERKDKNTIKLDHDIQAREREAPRGGRGGRGRGRGEGGLRGEGRGRGEGAFRGEGRGRGGRGRGESRGEFRGRGRGGPSPNLSDTSAFPSLGA